MPWALVVPAVTTVIGGPTQMNGPTPWTVLQMTDAGRLGAALPTPTLNQLTVGVGESVGLSTSGGELATISGTRPLTPANPVPNSLLSNTNSGRSLASCGRSNGAVCAAT